MNSIQPVPAPRYWQSFSCWGESNFPGKLHGSVGKESACNGGDPGSILRFGRSLGDLATYSRILAIHPLQCSCLENPMDREVWWATYSPWCCKESDMTEWLTHIHIQASWVVLVIKNPSEMQETQEMQVWSLGHKNSLEKEMATHSSILIREIPWKKDPGGLQSMALQSQAQLSNWAHP